MIQDINPRHYHCEYLNMQPDESALVLCYTQDEVYVRILDDNKLDIPRYSEFHSMHGEYRYLFSVDDQHYFLFITKQTLNSMALTPLPVSELRNTCPEWISYVCITGHQLFQWYCSNRYCGHCQSELQHSETERALNCPNCSQIIYPRISPAVIVGVIDADSILLTRHVGRTTRNYSLVAGFCEIGESVEDTVRREVMEETGIRVTDMQYYKSQPWSFSSSLLIGMYARAESGQIPVADSTELAEAAWHKREDIEPMDHPISLTAEMIQHFRMTPDILHNN